MGQTGNGLVSWLARRLPGWIDYDGEHMGSRVLSGRKPLPWFANWRITLAASDVDAERGVAAVRIVVRTMGLNPVGYFCLYELHGGTWRWLGGSRETGKDGRSGVHTSGLIHEGGAAVRRHGDNAIARYPDNSPAGAGWVACAMYHAAPNITRLTINGRPIAVPAHGHVLAAWNTPPSHWPPCHPHVVAIDRDGTQVAEFGPSDRLKSHTIINVTEIAE